MPLTGKGLVDFCYTKLGVPYVYGCKGEVLTAAKYNWLRSTYNVGGRTPIWDSDASKIGKVCCDCSGLISWYTGKMLGSSQLYSEAIVRKPISTIAEAPIGATLWCNGHVGVYVGIVNGVHSYIAEDGSAVGCRLNAVHKQRFTHWLLQSYIDYSNPQPQPQPPKPEPVKVDIGGFIDMTDAQIKQIVSEAYLTNMGRKADAAGLSHWISEAKNKNMQTVLKSIGYSEEALKYYVAGLYTNLLKRTGSNNEIMSWVKWIKNNHTKEECYDQFIKSNEYKKLKANKK